MNLQAIAKYCSELAGVLGFELTPVPGSERGEAESWGATLVGRLEATSLVRLDVVVELQASGSPAELEVHALAFLYVDGQRARVERGDYLVVRRLPDGWRKVRWERDEYDEWPTELPT